MRKAPVTLRQYLATHQDRRYTLDGYQAYIWLHADRLAGEGATRPLYLTSHIDCETGRCVPEGTYRVVSTEPMGESGWVRALVVEVEEVEA